MFKKLRDFFRTAPAPQAMPAFEPEGGPSPAARAALPFIDWSDTAADAGVYSGRGNWPRPVEPAPYDHFQATGCCEPTPKPSPEDEAAIRLAAADRDEVIKRRQDAMAKAAALPPAVLPLAKGFIFDTPAGDMVEVIEDATDENPRPMLRITPGRIPSQYPFGRERTSDEQKALDEAFSHVEAALTEANVKDAEADLGPRFGSRQEVPAFRVLTNENANGYEMKLPNNHTGKPALREALDLAREAGAPPFVPVERKKLERLRQEHEHMKRALLSMARFSTCYEGRMARNHLDDLEAGKPLNYNLKDL